MLHTTFCGLKMWRKPTPSLHKYNQNFKLNNCAISKNPETSHIFKPLLNAVLYFRNLINNTTFKRKVRFQLSIFTQTWFFAQRLVSRNVFSTQSFSARFGSDFTYHAKFFGCIFRNYQTEKQKRSFQRKFGKYIAFNVLWLKNVAKMQHQAFTNITKTLN